MLAHRRTEFANRLAVHSWVRSNDAAVRARKSAYMQSCLLVASPNTTRKTGVTFMQSGVRRFKKRKGKKEITEVLPANSLTS